MVTPALLESVRTLSIPDKVALIEAVSQMLQRELQNPSRANGHAKVDSLPAQDLASLPAHLKVGNQEMNALIAELVSRLIQRQIKCCRAVSSKACNLMKRTSALPNGILP